MNPTNEHQEQAREIADQWRFAMPRASVGQLTRAQWDDLEQRIVAALASRDTEIREVLEELVRWSTCAGGGEPVVRHWCNHEFWCGDECQAATALYAKLQPKEVEVE